MITRPLMGLLGRIILLVGVTASLDASGRVLPAPAVGTIHGLSAWWTRLGPVTATFAGVRLAAMALATVWGLALLVSVALAVLARSARVGPTSVRWLIAWSAARPWRHLLMLTVGLSVSTGSLAACGVAGAGSPRSDAGTPPVPEAPVLSGPARATGLAAPVEAGQPQGGQGVSAGRVAASRPQGAARGPAARGPAARVGAGTSHEAAGSPAASAVAAVPVHQAIVGRAVPGAGVSRQLAAGEEQPAAASNDGWGIWTVRPGDDFWSIAEAVVGLNAERPPGSVARYWASALSANRDRLPVPGDPDLLYPGDQIVLPPLGPAAG